MLKIQDDFINKVNNIKTKTQEQTFEVVGQIIYTWGRAQIFAEERVILFDLLKQTATDILIDNKIIQRRKNGWYVYGVENCLTDGWTLPDSLKNQNEGDDQ